MRKRFSNKSMTPPGGFRYTQTESQTEFRTITFKDILDKVRLHRLANGYMMGPGWEDKLESDMCENYEVGVWRFVDEPAATAGPRSVKVSDVLNFLKFAANWLSSGAQLVEPEIAEKRAEICRGCPLNQPIEGCSPCVQMAERVSRLVGARATKHDARLHGCSICGCQIRAMVWFPLESLQKSMTDSMFDAAPSWCWKAERKHL